MRDSSRRGWLLSLCVGAFALAGCEQVSALARGPVKESGAGPAQVQAAAVGAATPPAPSQPSAQQDQLLGKWCLRSLTATSVKTTSLDGSTWEFKHDGSYQYQGEIAQSGTWTLEPGKLTLTHVGAHELVELSAERMVLRRMSVDHDFHRDCGSEIARGRLAEKLRKTAAKGDWMMVQALLDDGADINLADPFDGKQRTALMTAAERGHAEVVKELLKRGAKVTTFDLDGHSVFDYARRRIPEVVTTLALHLPAPGSPDLPVLRKLPASNQCPTDYLEKALVCVHASALARPTLEDEYAAFAQGSPSATVASNPDMHAPEGEVALVAERSAKTDDRADPSRLDPGALSRPNGNPGSVGASSRATETRSTEGERRWAQVQDDIAASRAAQPAAERAADAQAYCESLREGIAEVRAGRETVSQDLGMSRSEYLAFIEAKYAQDCR